MVHCRLHGCSTVCDKENHAFYFRIFVARVLEYIHCGVEYSVLCYSTGICAHKFHNFALNWGFSA